MLELAPMTGDKSTHGGRRAGAGRPAKYEKSGATEIVTLTLPKRLVARLREKAAQRGISLSELVARRFGAK